MADEVLRQGVQGITDLITVPGLVNLDFADVRTIMNEAGSALMGIGRSVARIAPAKRRERPSRRRCSRPRSTARRGSSSTSPGGRTSGLFEVNEAAEVVTAAADTNANVIFGAVIDDALKDEVRVTVIATGFGGAGAGARDAGAPDDAPRRRPTCGAARSASTCRTSCSTSSVSRATAEPPRGP